MRHEQPADHACTFTYDQEKIRLLFAFCLVKRCNSPEVYDPEFIGELADEAAHPRESSDGSGQRYLGSRTSINSVSSFLGHLWSFSLSKSRHRSVF